MVKFRESAGRDQHDLIGFVETLRVEGHIGVIGVGNQPGFDARQSTVDKGFHDAAHAKVVEWCAKNNQIGGVVAFHCADHTVFIFVDALAGCAHPAGVAADTNFKIELADVDQFCFCASRFHAFEQGLEHVIGAAGFHAGGAVEGEDFHLIASLF